MQLILDLGCQRHGKLARSQWHLAKLDPCKCSTVQMWIHVPNKTWQTKLAAFASHNYACSSCHNMFPKLTFKQCMHAAWNYIQLLLYTMKLLELLNKVSFLLHSHLPVLNDLFWCPLSLHFEVNIMYCKLQPTTMKLKQSSKKTTQSSNQTIHKSIGLSTKAGCCKWSSHWSSNCPSMAHAAQYPSKQLAPTQHVYSQNCSYQSRHVSACTLPHAHVMPKFYHAFLAWQISCHFVLADFNAIL